MRLGIDFGTTRTVVAGVDRGNYPVVTFHTKAGDVQPWYPSLVACCGGEKAFGLEAQSKAQTGGWAVLRAFKRLLWDTHPGGAVAVGKESYPLLDLVTDYLIGLKEDLYRRSNLELSPDEPLEAFIAVPANASINQRFLTLEAFRRAGFKVLGMMNEPSAAGIEYAHRFSTRGRRENLVVYDLGGGTFDVSVVTMKERSHEILTNEGIARLGGEDFDARLLEIVLEAAGAPSLSPGEREALLEDCRAHKEGLHPNTRRMAFEVAGKDVIIPTQSFYQRCAPLVERTMEALETALSRTLGGEREMAAIYLVGGGSELPLVGRMLRERYGRRVRRSPHPHAATAIGLAIAADEAQGYALKERFTRYFGVWREAEEGRSIVFDPIFQKDTPLPRPGEPPLVLTRSYCAAHNIGHFRYLESSRLQDNQPAGDIIPWDEILFPIDPELRERGIGNVAVRRDPAMMRHVIEERYVCDAEGLIRVTLIDRSTGFEHTYHLPGA